MQNIKELSDRDFESEVLQSAEPVLVDFGRRGAVLAG